MKTLLTAAAVAALVVAAPVLAKGEKSPMPAFEEMDQNADGQVTQQELDSYRSARFAMEDANGDGALDRAELIAAIKARFDPAMREKKREKAADKMAERMFKRMDANKDQVISFEESSSGRSARFFTIADTDRDGAISRAENDAMQARAAEHAHNRKQRDDGMADPAPAN